MREIKFQVVDRKGKIRGYEQWDESMAWSHIDCAEPVSEDGSPWIHSGILPNEFPERYLRRQYTGLHDKNGKEIYEGDILRYKDNLSKANGEISRKDSSSVTVIKWMEYGFGYHKYDTAWDYDGLPFESEVIGNIYENPELLQ